MIIRILCIIISINTWCFGQLPGEQGTESTAHAGIKILLRNSGSFTDDPSVLHHLSGWTLQIQRLQRFQLELLSSNRISLSLGNFGLSISQQAGAPLQIWQGLVAAGLPTKGAFRCGVYLAANTLQSIDRSLDIYQYTGCVSWRYRISSNLLLGARWEHAQFSNRLAFSKPSIVARFQIRENWDVSNNIEWNSFDERTNFRISSSLRTHSQWRFTAGISYQPFSLSVSGAFQGKHWNLMFAWMHGSIAGPLSSQSVQYQNRNSDED